MGLFDEVCTQCPHCGADMDWQSKAGECVMRRYSLGDCPTEIGRDLKDTLMECDNCKRVFKFTFEEIVKPMNIAKIVEI